MSKKIHVAELLNIALIENRHTQKNEHAKICACHY